MLIYMMDGLDCQCNKGSRYCLPLEMLDICQNRRMLDSRESASFREVIEFMSKFRDYALYNNLLDKVQTFVLTSHVSCARVPCNPF